MSSARLQRRVVYDLGMKGRRGGGATEAERTVTTLAIDGARQTLVRRFSLRVTAGPDEGKIFHSVGPRACVGTHESADLVLGDPTVSRFHFEIALGATARLRDLDSKNGTFLEGVSIVDAHLPESARLRVGKTEIAFTHGEDHVAVPLSERTSFGSLTGRSMALRGAFSLLERAAQSNAAVLLEGEAGAGKQTAAESIHRESVRAPGPFVVVDCRDTPPDLLAREMLGRSTSSSDRAEESAFEAARGGTLYLRGVEALPLGLQGKLSKALDACDPRRAVGQSPPVDVRIIAGTTVNLRARVNARTFRSELFYRLAVVQVHLPPLRERKEDLQVLVEQFLAGAGATDEDACELRSPQFVASLERHGWPDNVRELRAYVDRCLALRTRVPIAPVERSAADDQPAFDVPLRIARERWSRDFERRYVTELLERSSGNVTAAARAAGVDRMYFYRLLWRHGLK
jgi:two-component system, NtrC family, response regulator GlrR